MSKREIYEQKTEELIMPLIEQHQFELVDVEYVKEGGNWYLRAYIDKPGGITVDDCELVSRAAGMDCEYPLDPNQASPPLQVRRALSGG